MVPTPVNPFLVQIKPIVIFFADFILKLKLISFLDSPFFLLKYKLLIKKYDLYQPNSA